MKSDPRPYSAGFNGHAFTCDCVKCAAIRAKVARKRAASVAPTTYDRTVYVREYVVRSHMRRNPNHLGNFPVTFKAVIKMLKDLQKGRKNSVYK